MRNSARQELATARAAAAASSDSVEPSTPATIVWGHVSGSRAGRAMRTGHGASCSILVATVPSRSPTVRMRPCEPTASSVACSASLRRTVAGSPFTILPSAGTSSLASAMACSASSCMSPAACRAAIPACADLVRFIAATSNRLPSGCSRRFACFTANRLSGVPSMPHTMRSKMLVCVAPLVATIAAYGGDPASIQARKRSTCSDGQRASQGMLPSASRW